VAHQIDLVGSILVPQVDSEDEKGAVNLPRHTGVRGCMDGRQGNTYSYGISAPVAASVTMSLMQGGGVMGLRSCKRFSKRLGRRVRARCSYLVAKTTHAGPDGLLLDLQPART
jgi:hypothetical protein